LARWGRSTCAESCPSPPSPARSWPPAVGEADPLRRSQPVRCRAIWPCTHRTILPPSTFWSGSGVAISSTARSPSSFHPARTRRRRATLSKARSTSRA